MLNRTFLKFFLTFALIIGLSILVMGVLNSLDKDNGETPNASVNR